MWRSIQCKIQREPGQARVFWFDQDTSVTVLPSRDEAPRIDELTRLVTTQILHRPIHHLRQPVAQSVAGRIPESPPRLVDIGQGVTHIARSAIAIVRLDVAQMGEAGGACLADGLEECVERGALADGDIVELIDGGGVTDGRGRGLGWRALGVSGRLQSPLPLS
jgi:hypothetical protein